MGGNWKEKRAFMSYACKEFLRPPWSCQKEKKKNCGDLHDWVQKFFKVNEEALFSYSTP
jgi:hypothetical protein